MFKDPEEERAFLQYQISVRHMIIVSLGVITSEQLEKLLERN